MLLATMQAAEVTVAATAGDLRRLSAAVKVRVRLLLSPVSCGCLTALLCDVPVAQKH